MKIYKNLQGKILLTSTLGLLLVLPSAVFAVNTNTLSGVIEASQVNSAPAPAATPAADKPTEVIVTEMVPGADCEPFGTGTGAAGKQYKCKVTGGFSSVMGIVSALIKYTTYITALIGVLMMVITGIAYMFGEWEFKKEMKEKATQVIIGLTTLFLVAFILNTIAPWIYS